MLDHGDRLAAGRLEGAAPTLVRMAVTRPRVLEGETVALLAQVVTPHRDAAPPSGTVAFRAGHRLLGTAPLDPGGTARLEGVRLPAGVHPLVASYGGDPGHAAATSVPVPQAVVVPASPVTVAVQAPADGPSGVVLQAELLDPRTGRLVEEATGSLTFALDGVLLGSAPLRGGEATLQLPALGPGRVSARFAGDLEHAPGEGSAPTPADR